MSHDKNVGDLKWKFIFNLPHKKKIKTNQRQKNDENKKYYYKSANDPFKINLRKT